jgi:hypothetical protein
MTKPAFNKKENSFQHQIGDLRKRLTSALIRTTLCIVLELGHREVDQKYQESF